MATNTVRVGNVEIMALSDGLLEFDLCNFFPTIPEDNWKPYESHLTHDHHVRFNLGSYLIRHRRADRSRRHGTRASSYRTRLMSRGASSCAISGQGREARTKWTWSC